MAEESASPATLAEPGWPPPDQRAHDSLRPNIYAASAICWTIAAIFVGLRFYTRKTITRQLGWSDWCILISLVFAAGTTAGGIEQAVHGGGAHIWDLDRNDTQSALNWGKASWYSLLFYIITLYFTKLSILMLYIHVFTYKWARTSGQVLVGIVTISHLFNFIATCTAAIPLKAYWDFRMLPEESYKHTQSVWWAGTSMHMITDFLIFLLPMPVVWSLNLPRRQKLMLFGVFSLGFIICFISIIRLVELVRNDKKKVNPSADWTYESARLLYLTAIEINGAIVVSCIMTLKPLMTRFFPNFLGSSSLRRGSNPNDGGLDTNKPPTIGSKPMKALVNPDIEIHSSTIPRGRKQGQGHGHTTSPGYMELEDDSWVIDVELAENTNEKPGESSGSGSGSGDSSSNESQIAIMRRQLDATAGEKARSHGHGFQAPRADQEKGK